jgi:uncharacterized protein (TIGR03790 family)
MPPKAFMVARLDGPDPETVRRIVDDSIYAEKKGLQGVAYFDARQREVREESKPPLKGDVFYAKSIFNAAARVEEEGTFKVVVNTDADLFQPGECPDAALYVGWYRRANYLDAFDWRRGAIGYHIASSECATLRNKGSNGWCIGMLNDGVAAVIGPVGEPYLQAFPPPELFFSLLLDGRFSLVEAFALSVPYRSWRMILVGDPLYRPLKSLYRKRPEGEK